MLFDLQSRGRKNVVRVIYLGLAVLMGGGLVLFGIGTGEGGGLFDVFSNRSSDTTVQVSAAQKRAEAAVRRDPQNARAWAEVARTRFVNASVGGAYDETTGTYTAEGRKQLRSAVVAWDRYLALDPAEPDANVARLMANAFGQGALERPARAAQAIEIVTEVDPSASAYAQLAQAAYVANQLRKGDLAAQKAVQLSPKETRESIRRQLAAIRRQVTQRAIQDAVNQGAVTTPSG